MKLLWFMVVALGMAWGQGWLQSILLPSKQAVATVCNKAIADSRLGIYTVRKAYESYMSDPTSALLYALSPLGVVYSNCALNGRAKWPPSLTVTIGGWENTYIPKRKVVAVFYDDSGRVLGRIEPHATDVFQSQYMLQICPSCPPTYDGYYEFDPTKRADIIGKATVLKFMFMDDGLVLLTLSKKTMPNWR